MKVLIVTNMYPSEKRPVFGIFVKEQADAVKQYHPDVEYEIYCIEGGGVQGASKIKSFKNYIKSIIEIDRILKKGSYDLIHVHYGFSGLFLLNPFRNKVPTLVTLHGGDIQPEQKKQFQVLATRKLLRKADFAITLNERMDVIARNYIHQTCIIPCAVNTDLFEPPAKVEKEERRIPIVVFPSDKQRFVKNYPLFVKVIAILKEKYGIECEAIEVKGMSREEVKCLYQKADLMLMTSISEGSPQVVKEAMACNLPVVSTPVGDVKILLENVKGSAVAENNFDANELGRLCYLSLEDKIPGIDGFTKIMQLGLDCKSVSEKIYSIYKIIKEK